MGLIVLNECSVPTGLSELPDSFGSLILGQGQNKENYALQTSLGSIIKYKCLEINSEVFILP